MPVARSKRSSPGGCPAANAVFFRIGAMAYNLFVMFKTHVLPEEWNKHQV